MRTENNVRASKREGGWRFISERNVIILVGLSFRKLRKLRPSDIFAKIIATGVRTENKIRVGVLRY